MFSLMFVHVSEKTHSVCLKINIVIAESFTGCQFLPFEADCWTEPPLYSYLYVPLKIFTVTQMFETQQYRIYTDLLDV